MTTVTAPNPYAKRTRTPQEALALWIATNQPEVFKALVRDANRSGRLNGVTDWLTGVGTSIGSAVTNVGSFISSPDGMKSLMTIGNTYLQVQAQRDALRTQTRLAQSGQYPASIASVGANPYTSLPVYVDPATGQQIPFNSQVASQLRPSFNWTPIFIGGGVLAALYILTR